MPRSRRLVLDLLYFNKEIDLCPHDRCFDLGRLAEVRSRLPRRIAWPLLFIKSFGIMAANRPELRQSFQRWPWQHIYQHSQTVAMLATHRVYQGEPWVFHSKFERPEEMPLVVLQAGLDRYLNAPVEKIFKQQWQLSLLPTLARRMIWWFNLNVLVSKRAHRAGTFFLTTLAGKGVEIQNPPGFLPINLTYGPLDERNRCRVTISYDHRLMDGSFIADRLIELESILNGAIVEELESIITASRS